MADIDFGSEENKRLLKRLFAYALDLFKQLYKTDPNWKGKSFKDYVIDAIVRHLADEDHFDPKKSPLEYHLKYHVIRRALTNDLPPAVKKEYRQSRKETSEDLEMRSRSPIEYPEVNPDEIGEVSLFINQIENQVLFKEIETEINGDSIVEQIYLAVIYDKYNFSDRAEICADFNISAGDFDNGRRRLITILKRVFKNLNIKS